MSTYSLNLRSNLDRKLTISEMDGNFLYLKDLAILGTSSIGPTGPAGNNGATGPAGNTGPAGATGSQGNNGATGSQGPEGLSGNISNGYRGFYSGINRLFGDDPTITQIVISKSSNAIYKNKNTYDTDSEDFYVTGLSGSDTVVILNIYGLDHKRSLKLKDIRNFVEKFVDIVLYAEGTTISDLSVIREQFYNNIELLTNSLPVGSLYNQFVFQDKDIEYIMTPDDYNTTSMTGSGTFSLHKSIGASKGYNLSGGEGEITFTYGFEADDIITISGTALGGQSPDNDATIYINSVNNGVIDTFEVYSPGTGYTDGYYNVNSPTGNQAYVYITTATGSVVDATLLSAGAGYTIFGGEGDIIWGGNNDASIAVLSIRDGVINNHDVIGTPDYRSPYRNSQNPWPVMSISDGGNDQYDNGNFITTDKSITQFIGSIEETQVNNGSFYTLTVTEIISGTISIGQTVRHNTSDYTILTGTLTGGVGTYSISSYYENDQSEQIFKAYGINYGGGEIVENNTFGTSSSYVTLYDESIFAMIAINADINEIYYTGDYGSDGSSNSKKEVNVLIADNNTLSFGEEKLELSNKDLILPETDTLGWMSVLGPLYNNDDDIVFNSTIIDDYENTYVVGYEHNDNKPIVLKFNKQGDKLWSKRIYSDEYVGSGYANSVEIDPINGELVVLCEFSPDYTESFIVRIDPMNGNLITSNRLKDINVLSQQGDLYLKDMTFNSDNEIIMVGEKTTDYLEWIIGTSSVLLGSTVSTLVISTNSIDNDIPQGTFGWSIAGTGIIGDENLYDINTFIGVTGTLTPGGVSASFTIQSDNENGYYTILGIDNPGTGYSMSVLKPIVVPGTSLGGITPDNDATILQTDVLNGGIVSATITGLAASGVGTASFTGVTGTTIEGSGANFIIHNNQNTGEYSVNGVEGQQSNYVLNDIITIPGSLLGGTSSNDLTLRTAYVDNGIIQGVDIIGGTGSTSSLYLTLSTNVDFSASGTWSIYKSLFGEAYIYTENWERTLIGDANDRFESVITDENNNIYCVGVKGGYNTYDKAIITKFNQNGDLQWTKVLNELPSNCYGHSVAIFGTNSVITTHYSDNYESIIISKITLSGDLIWQKRTTSRDSDIVTDLVTDNTGIYIAVEKYDNFYDRTSIRLFKLNSDGILIWNNTIGGREGFYLKSISIKNEKIVVAGKTYTMADDYYNAFVVNLPTDGTLAFQDNNSYSNYTDRSGITNYVKGNYVIQSVTFSFYESITPQVGTHSITYTIEKLLYDSNYDIDNNLDRINEESGIIFGDGTKQTSSAGIIPQNYQPSNDHYYLKLSDIGKHIYKDDSNDNYGIYIPTNENVPFPIGTAITVVSGDSWTYFRLDDPDITKLWGAGFNNYSTSFFIPNNSMATLLKIGIDKWMVSGAGLDID